MGAAPLDNLLGVVNDTQSDTQAVAVTHVALSAGINR
jgi:hypothetical protein